MFAGNDGHGGAVPDGVTRAVLLVAIVALAACSSPSPVASSSPPATTPASPFAPPAASATPAPSASPVATVDVAYTGLSLNCRLPVSWPVKSGQTYTYTAGFISFPTGALTVDPAAPAGSVFYDRALSRWLPVYRPAVSPDGKRYAYSEGNAFLGTAGKLHVVDVATGADRVIYSGDRVYAVVDFAADGLYLTAAAPEGRPRGLWWQDPTGGAATLISSSIASPAVGGGAGWGADFNTADPSPGPGGLEGPMNRLLRFDLRTGTSSPWFYKPGSNLYVMGFDPVGHPLVSTFVVTDPSGQGTNEIWLVVSQTSAVAIFSGTGAAIPSRLAALDGHGEWFDGGSQGGTVWLSVAGSTQVVASASIDGLLVAGGCIS